MAGTHDIELSLRRGRTPFGCVRERNDELVIQDGLFPTHFRNGGVQELVADISRDDTGGYDNKLEASSVRCGKGRALVRHEKSEIFHIRDDGVIATRRRSCMQEEYLVGRVHGHVDRWRCG